MQKKHKATVEIHSAIFLTKDDRHRNDKIKIMKKVSYPIVRAGYIPKEMLRPFIDTRGILTTGLCLVQYCIYTH